MALTVLKTSDCKRWGRGGQCGWEKSLHPAGAALSLLTAQRNFDRFRSLSGTVDRHSRDFCRFYAGEAELLPKLCIDTGEDLRMILQETTNVFPALANTLAR